MKIGNKKSTQELKKVMDLIFQDGISSNYDAKRKIDAKRESKNGIGTFASLLQVLRETK